MPAISNESEVQNDNLFNSRKSIAQLNHFISQATTLNSNDSDSLIQLIQQVLTHPSVHVFGEFIDLPIVQELKGTSNQNWFDLLQVFAFGTYADYDETYHPVLTDQMLRKLQYLTIVSLAAQNRKLSYDSLLKELRLQHVRQLEDLIIEAVYANLIKGKLDQKQRCLEVDSTMSRDVRTEQIGTMVSVLGDWLSNCDSVLLSIEQQIANANEVKEQTIQKRNELELCIGNLRKAVKSNVSEMDEMWEQVNSGTSPPPGSKDVHQLKRMMKSNPKGAIKLGFLKTWMK